MALLVETAVVTDHRVVTLREETRLDTQSILSSHLIKRPDQFLITFTGDERTTPHVIQDHFVVTTSFVISLHLIIQLHVLLTGFIHATLQINSDPSAITVTQLNVDEAKHVDPTQFVTDSLLNGGELVPAEQPVTQLNKELFERLQQQVLIMLPPCQ